MAWNEIHAGKHFNEVPPNFKEITTEEWAQSDWFTYSPEKVEFRQFLYEDVNGKPVFQGFRLFHMPHGHGYALTNDYWNKKVRIFRFGCNHQWKELSFMECRDRDIKHFGQHWHVRECQLCKQIDGYDSSG